MSWKSCPPLIQLENWGAVESPSNRV